MAPKYVFALTGTPILNRPKELITQLQILNRLEDVAPTPSKGRNDAKSYEFAFKFRYCGPENTGWGWTFDGRSNSRELNDKLRSTCFIRRERTDVLGFNETVRIPVLITLNGELTAYRKAEKDLIEFIRAERGNKAAARAQRAEEIVRLNTLRRLAEEAKIPAVIEWIENWLDSYPEKKLVVFAGHVSVQRALADYFQCPTILGSQRDVEAQKALFQEGDARLIVCSLQAAREGHTLTAASDVVFTSLGWTSGGLQQAEDRCNRIGQTAKKVVAWQLLAEGTVEEDVLAVIEEKRKTFNAVVRGDEVDNDESDVIDQVLGGFLAKLDAKSAPKASTAPVRAPKAPAATPPAKAALKKAKAYNGLARNARGRR